LIRRVSLEVLAPGFCVGKAIRTVSFFGSLDSAMVLVVAKNCAKIVCLSLDKIDLL
jgi:hypothetical protein